MDNFELACLTSLYFYLTWRCPIPTGTWRMSPRVCQEKCNSGSDFYSGSDLSTWTPLCPYFKATVALKQTLFFKQLGCLSTELCFKVVKDQTLNTSRCHLSAFSILRQCLYFSKLYDNSSSNNLSSAHNFGKLPVWLNLFWAIIWNGFNYFTPQQTRLMALKCCRTYLKWNVCDKMYYFLQLVLI